MQRDLGSVLILIRTDVGTGFIPCLHISHRQDKYTNDKYCESHLLMPVNVKESSGTWSRLPAANIAKVDCHVKCWKMLPYVSRCFFTGRLPSACTRE